MTVKDKNSLCEWEFSFQLKGKLHKLFLFTFFCEDGIQFTCKSLYKQPTLFTLKTVTEISNCVAN